MLHNEIDIVLCDYNKNIKTNVYNRRIEPLFIIKYIIWYILHLCIGLKENQITQSSA